MGSASCGAPASFSESFCARHVLLTSRRRAHLRRFTYGDCRNMFHTCAVAAHDQSQCRLSFFAALLAGCDAGWLCFCYPRFWLADACYCMLIALQTAFMSALNWLCSCGGDCSRPGLVQEQLTRACSA